MFAFMANAQTNPTAVATDASIIEPYYKVVTLDTLVDASNISFEFRVKGSQAMDFKIGLYSDRLSGTAAGTMIGYGSLDGVVYVSLGDTITFSGLSADNFDTETLDYTDFMWPYLKLTVTQTGTTAVIHKPWVYSKF